jgi:predicted O-linked N-acetylglucosamine transferase (SPINDLY family)
VDYFKLFDRVDIVLDTFPYTGHTTGFDAAWMGVPFVTLAGDTAVGRGGVSILSNLGMTDWIANNPAQYVAIAARWANDLAGLSELRAGLRQRMESSALMNGPKFAADVEAVFWQMWRDWCFRQL